MVVAFLREALLERQSKRNPKARGAVSVPHDRIAGDRHGRPRGLPHHFTVDDLRDAGIALIGDIRPVPESP